MLNSIVVLKNGIFGRITKVFYNGLYQIDNKYFITFDDILKIQKQF